MPDRIGELVKMDGGRNNSSVYLHEPTKHTYKRHRKADDSTNYFQCSLSRCNATACVRRDGRFVANRPHNHIPDEGRLNSHKLLSACRERSSNENTPVKVIFEEEMAK